ncbi:MAG: TonB-dependent receptor [Armatimonadia bacterium]
MKRTTIPLLVALGLLLGPLGSVWGQSHQRATIIRVQNLVKVRRTGGGRWTPAAKAMPLYSRDEVQTYQKSRATITLEGGGRVEMMPLSHLVIPATTREGSRLNVLTGRVLFWLIGATPLEVGAAGATAAAKGTQFVMDVSADGRTVCTVIEGTVDFYNDFGAVTLHANEQSSATATTAPTRPMRVDPSSYIEWEASLDNVWMGFEKLYSPSGTSADQLAAARQKAATGDVAAQVAYADLLHDAGDLEAANTAYHEALLKISNPAPLQMKLGYNLLQQGRSDEALRTFQQVGNGPTALAGQALALTATLADKNQAQAEQLVAQALAAAPADPDVLIAVGLVSIRGGDSTAALKALTQAAQQPSPDYRALAYLSAVQLAEKQGEAALQSARKAVSLAPCSGLAHESLGTAAFYAGDLQEAADEAQAALKLAPNSPTAHVLAANVAVAQGDMTGGMHEAEMALSLDPRQAPAWQLLGMISLTQNNLKRAEKTFNKALDLQPKLVAAQTGQGLALARQGKLGQALQAQQAAMALDPDQAAAHNNLGTVYLQKGRLDEAKAEFERALQLQPNWGLVHANLALAHLEANEFAQAVHEGELAVKLGERSARTYTTLGRVYLKQNRVNKAWAALRQALENDSNYALARMHLAEVYFRLGRSQEAQRERLKAISLQPSVIVDNRGYARTEAIAAGGDGMYAQLRTNGRDDDGQTSYYLAGDHQEGDWDRSRTHFDNQTVVGIVGQQKSADRTTSLLLSANWDSRPQPGRALAGGAASDTNYTSRFDGQEFNYLTRSALSDTADFTFRAGYRNMTQHDNNPDAAITDLKLFPQLRLASQGPLMEMRLDKRYGPSTDLVAGVALARERRSVSGVLAIPTADPLSPEHHSFDNVLNRDFVTGYLEYQWLLDPRTRILAGGRVAISDDTKPVFRPKVSVRRRVSDSGTLVLLTRPLLADDVSEVSPVESWASRPFMSPLDLARGGYSQSYELQYECQPAGSLLRATLFHRDLRNLLVDLQDPAWATGAAPLVLDSASTEGAELELERWLGRDLSGGVWARYTDSESDDAAGREVPYQPKLAAQARLDYLNADGWRLALIWQHVGKRYADQLNAERLGSYSLFNFSVARQFNLHTDVFVTAENLLDREYRFYQGYPERGRQVQAGLQYRF